MIDRILVTCEHAGNYVPSALLHLFAKARRVVNSHRGYDIGAFDLARRMARRLRVPILTTRTSRLVVEVNRSIGHRHLFSEFTKTLPREERTALLARYYHPHRNRVEERIASWVANRCRVLHISVHSFTPVKDGQRRRADVGLLYDPGRRRERLFAAAWKSALLTADARLCIRRNYPYRGELDGLTTWLRQRFGSTKYLGMELELNNRQLRTADRRRNMAALVTRGTAAAIEALKGESRHTRPCG